MKIKKIKRLIPAIGVSIVAFFELSLTGTADRSWRIARADKSVLSLRPAGDGTDDITSKNPRLRHLLRRGAGFNSHSSPGPAPIFYILILAAVVGIAIAAALIVARPDGREDGVVYGTPSESPASATEGQSSYFLSSKETLIMIGCMTVSAALAIATINLRKESYFGKERKSKHRR